MWSACGLAFTLVTWNINEISNPNQDRITSLLNTAIDGNPDILLLQEGDLDVLKTIRSNRGLREKYKTLYFETRSGDPRGGLIILAQRQLLADRLRYEVFPSEMGRGTLILPIQLCDSRVMLANVHLESADLLTWSKTRDFRHQQIQRLQNLAAGSDGWIVVGDFNPVFEADADHWFPKGWEDAWLLLHPNDPGLTWDPHRNLMAWKQGGFVLPGFRLDRLVYKQGELVAVKAELMGVGSDPPLSDHFGLRVTFNCK